MESSRSAEASRAQAAEPGAAGIAASDGVLDGASEQAGLGDPLGRMTPPLSPPVEGDRLISQLQGLIGERYEIEDRAAIRQQLTEQLQGLGFDVEAQTFDDGRGGQGTNLVATYGADAGGKDPIAAAKNSILVGAHYDTVQGSPGADDNGTGVAVLLELAALYAQEQQAGPKQSGQGRHPEPGRLAGGSLAGGRSLTLVFFDLEEAGLLGSLAFTAQPENLRPIHSAVILDMLGASCGEPGCQQYPAALEGSLLQGKALSDVGDFIAVVGEANRLDLLGVFGGGADAQEAAGGEDAGSDAPLTAQPRNARPDVLLVPVPLKGLLTPDVLRSDHAPFWLNGVGAVLVTDTANLRSPHYHQPSDDFPTWIQRFCGDGPGGGGWGLAAVGPARWRVSAG
ncbi:MAG: M28 family peptidase [Synechococcales cyanobacterium RM1_1_8]|nr:M28 family peptidase [Synechococcales cyanobacterium RM1_1_8]